ncbi:MAG: ABC transporter permease [Rhodobacteraceae bacterium]|nr:ABC transporter permease [Paracoccaceae bacterium]
MKPRSHASRYLIFYVGIFLIFLYSPALLLPIFSFNDATIIAFPLTGFTLKWFNEVFQSEVLIQSAVNSLIVALITSIAATILGVFAARASIRHDFRGKFGIMGIIMIPMFLPEIIVGVALLVMLLQLGFNLSLSTIILGHTLICMPFCTAILSTGFQGLDHSMEEASLDLGRNKFDTFRLIILPLIMPAIISSVLISFTISLDEFIIAFFLSGTETTLPVYIWGQLRFPTRIPIILALGTLMLLVSLTLLFAADYFRRLGIKKTGLQDKGGLF